MKTSTIVIGLGLVAAAVYFGNLATAGNVLEYYLQSFSMADVNTARIVIMVQNPSNASIVLNSMAGTVTANGTLIGNISNFQGGLTIPANGERPVTVIVNLSLLTIVGSIAQLLTSGTGINQVVFNVQGNANINNGIIVPFNINQTLPV